MNITSFRIISETPEGHLVEISDVPPEAKISLVENLSGDGAEVSVSSFTVEDDQDQVTIQVPLGADIVVEASSERGSSRWTYSPGQVKQIKASAKKHVSPWIKLGI